MAVRSAGIFLCVLAIIRGSLASADLFRRNSSSSSSRVLGGRPVTGPAEFPFQASIFKRGLLNLFHRSCAGSLIAPTWVLTSGRCCDEPDQPKMYRVSAGLVTNHVDATDIEHNRKVKRVIRHENYRNNEVNLVNDVCLMELSRSFPPASKPVALALALPSVDPDSEATPTAETAGYGAHGRPLADVSGHNLTAVELPLVPLDDCRKIYKDAGDFEVPDKSLCAGGYTSSGQEDAVNAAMCKGDSGAALVVRNANTKETEQIGIASWGFACKAFLQSLPSVFTDVTQYRDWIKEHSGI